MAKNNDTEWGVVGNGSSEMSETWDFKNVPSIVGMYISKKTNVGVNSSEIYMLDCDGVKFSVWESTVLKEKMNNIPFNTKVQIKYLGKAKGKTASYNNFEVNVPTGTELLDGSVV